MIPDGDTIVSCKGLGRESIRWERAEERERTNEKISESRAIAGLQASVVFASAVAQGG